MENSTFKIANLTEAEYASIKEAEALVRSKLGRDFVLIAWEAE